MRDHPTFWKYLIRSHSTQPVKVFHFKTSVGICTKKIAACEFFNEVHPNVFCVAAYTFKFAFAAVQSGLPANKLFAPVAWVANPLGGAVLHTDWTLVESEALPIGNARAPCQRRI